jgi:hypothetical protein
MATSKIKGVDEPTLEGGIGGASAGYRSARGANEKRLQENIDNMSAKERAALDNPGKQFETRSPLEEKAMEKVRKYRPTENTTLGKRERSWYELSDAERASLTPRQRKQMGGDLDSFKKGGAVSASRRADGIAARGKTRGRMV